MGLKNIILPLVTSIGYGGNGKAYTTPTRTLFVRLTLFVYDPYTYPSDVYLKGKRSHSDAQLDHGKPSLRKAPRLQKVPPVYQTDLKSAQNSIWS